MSAKRKQHVLDDWATYGGFHREFAATCRCGWTFKHYSACHVRDEYLAHKTEREAAGELWQDRPEAAS